VSAESACVKWIVSSWNRDDIEEWLGLGDSHTRLSLELNADHISHAVGVYIDYKVSKLASLRNDKTLQERVRDQIRRSLTAHFCGWP
jgi:hypothetical protein